MPARKPQDAGGIRTWLGIATSNGRQLAKNTNRRQTLERNQRPIPPDPEAPWGTP